MTLLVDRLGAERAAAIIEEAGGERLVIPPALDQGDAPRPLEVRFGRDLAIVLVIHYGGEVVYVPNGKVRGGPRRVHLAEVVRRTIARESSSTIARALGCSDRIVHLRRAEARALGLLPDHREPRALAGRLAPRR